ncbi:glutathione S-transferase family protein [Albimonas sp. CAU 1670]|uniref:glutathione S-transferase family protein n=1 Tax=Albimonas sp. CAU 1670 TaxID=3032599 RepID=UPI0023DB61A3|nr:glutathione S-transferase family protein [Albimonas sp. CAU 1670]MDF2231088.1 glutathione S-transferase family protein [Albimonas sp. CAU 1670]
MTTPPRVTLHGYQHSIYSWAVRLALSEKGVDWDWAEVDPFAEPERAARRHPFAKVPVLVHGAFSVFETVAILQYVDEAFDGPALQPTEPQARARMRQVQAIADAYAYWPMVRLLYAQRVFRPRHGEEVDRAIARDGLSQSRPVLDALEALTGEGPYFGGETPTLADLHLAPIVAAFAEAPEGGALLAGRRRLKAWLAAMQARPAFVATRPW